MQTLCVHTPWQPLNGSLQEWVGEEAQLQGHTAVGWYSSSFPYPICSCYSAQEVLEDCLGPKKILVPEPSEST